MKNLLCLLFVIIGFIARAQNKVFDYAYSKNMNVYVYSVANKKEYLVAGNATNPNLSPDGKKLAYTANTNNNRLVAIVDLNTRKKTMLNTHNSNCYGPVWSPNGKLIVYNIFNVNKKSEWLPAVINADNTGNKVLQSGTENIYSPMWTADSKNIIGHDMKKIMVLDLKGHTIKAYNFNDLAGDLKELKDIIGGSSSDVFTLIADGKKLVFCSSTNEPGREGPPSAIFLYDVTLKKTTRLSPKGYDAFQFALQGNTVLFSASKGNSYKPGVYTINMDGGNFKLLFAGCTSISTRLN